MHQVLFHIPDGIPLVGGLPIFGYGMMLFLAFVSCTWLASRLALRQGIAPQHVQDLAIWLFVFGIIGARLTFMIQYRNEPEYKDLSLTELVVHFFMIWEGGLVFYGSAIGGTIGYLLAYCFVLRRHNISSWKMADVIAPCVPLGLALGRIGCLLNGCCYGNVACPDCPAIHFPLSAPPRYDLVRKGYQTVAGFTLTDEASRIVKKVEPGSEAQRAGLKPDDLIVKLDGKEVASSRDLRDYLSQSSWPKGKNNLVLTVKRRVAMNGQSVERELTLPAFSPLTIGLHPTQLYETISMVLLLAAMLAYWPFRRRDGELMVIFMLAYAVHRFLNEILRDDTKPVFAGMTLSQNGSILVFLAGLVVLAWLWRRPPQYRLVADGAGDASAARSAATPAITPAAS
jgi:phosphatidylglycerol---prolipoprotein diacylglyceryl transferase